jgi:hypothetical protein
MVPHFPKLLWVKIQRCLQKECSVSYDTAPWLLNYSKWRGFTTGNVITSWVPFLYYTEMHYYGYECQYPHVCQVWTSQCSPAEHRRVQYRTIEHSKVEYSLVQYSKVQYVLYCTLLCSTQCTVMFWMKENCTYTLKKAVKPKRLCTLSLMQWK